MASLVESGVKNLNHGDADSVGFFQMRVGIWNKGEYAGFPEKPELQAKWFIDTALDVKRNAIAKGDADFGKDPAKWGEWIADTERPAEQYRYRYQLRLDEARKLLERLDETGGACAPPVSRLSASPRRRRRRRRRRQPPVGFGFGVCGCCVCGCGWSAAAAAASAAAAAAGGWLCGVCALCEDAAGFFALGFGSRFSVGSLVTAAALRGVELVPGGGEPVDRGVDVLAGGDGAAALALVAGAILGRGLGGRLLVRGAGVLDGLGQVRVERRVGRADLELAERAGGGGVRARQLGRRGRLAGAPARPTSAATRPTSRPCRAWPGCPRRRPGRPRSGRPGTPCPR